MKRLLCRVLGHRWWSTHRYTGTPATLTYAIECLRCDRIELFPEPDAPSYLSRVLVSRSRRRPPETQPGRIVWAELLRGTADPTPAVPRDMELAITPPFVTTSSVTVEIKPRSAMQDGA